MRIQVSVTEDDYISYNIYHYFHSKSTKSNILTGRLMPFLISVLGAAILIKAGNRGALLYSEIAILALYSIVGFFYYPKTAEKAILKNISKLRKEGKLPYTQEAVLDFEENEIIETSEDSIKHIPYSSVLKVCKTEAHVYVMIGAMEAIIIPHQCLENVDAFLEFINNKCQQAAA